MVCNVSLCLVSLGVFIFVDNPFFLFRLGCLWFFWLFMSCRFFVFFYHVWCSCDFFLWVSLRVRCSGWCPILVVGCLGGRLCFSCAGWWCSGVRGCAGFWVLESIWPYFRLVSFLVRIGLFCCLFVGVFVCVGVCGVWCVPRVLVGVLSFVGWWGASCSGDWWGGVVRSVWV